MTTTYKTILYATDLAEQSDPAFQQALSLAKHYQATLLLLHVIEPLSDSAMAAVNVYFPSGSLEKFYSDSLDEAFANINKKMEALYQQDIQNTLPDQSIQTYVLEGVPATTILKTAEKMHADLIVMGSHSHGYFDRLVMGSVANKVLNSSTLPVLLVPTAKT